MAESTLGAIRERIVREGFVQPEWPPAPVSWQRKGVTERAGAISRYRRYPGVVYAESLRQGNEVTLKG